MRSFGIAPPIGFSGDEAAGAQAPSSTWARGAVASLRDRLVPPMPPASIWGWAAAGDAVRRVPAVLPAEHSARDRVRRDLLRSRRLRHPEARRRAERRRQ